MISKKFDMLAVDQRSSFIKALKKVFPRVTKSLVKDVKEDIIRTLAPFAGAVLIDPVYSLDLADLVKGSSKLLFCLEKSGVKKTKGGWLTELQPGFSVAKAKRLGAFAVKLNLHYSPLASKKVVNHQRNLVKKVGRACKEHKIPFLLEIITYPFNLSVEEFIFRKPFLILDSVREFSKKDYNVRILKLQFPCDLDFVKGFSKKGFLFTKADCAEFCQLISKEVRVPWVLLSAGVNIRIFKEQLKIAMRNGCSGFLAGRAVWQDALKFKDKNKRLRWLRTKGLANLKALNKLVGVKR